MDALKIIKDVFGNYIEEIKEVKGIGGKESEPEPERLSFFDNESKNKSESLLYMEEEIKSKKMGGNDMKLILDVETTGKIEPRPVEIAWLSVGDIRGLDVIGKFLQRYNPEKPIEFGAMSVHHILNEEVQSEPSFKTFSLPAGAEYIIGHNIDYDWNAIGKPDVKRICTLALARKFFPEAHDFSHGALMYYFFEDRKKVRESLKNSHSALSDVRFCRSILHKLIEKINPASWEDLYRISEEARIPENMPFGKHKGMPIKDLPKDYVSWALKNLNEIDPYLKIALENA